MKLQELLRGLPIVEILNDSDPEVADLQFDSRRAQPGSLFVAVPGGITDGHRFLTEAARQGAIAVVVQKGSVFYEKMSDLERNQIAVPIVVVEDSRSALDFLACQLHGNPSRDLFCVGVTGTNGKTSLTYLLEYLFNFALSPMGVIGTIDNHILVSPPRKEALPKEALMGEPLPKEALMGASGAKRKVVWPPDGTTPNPVLLQERLREFLSLGAKSVALEVTSHALEQKRSDSVSFDMGIFTNLTQDHLDYHLTMEKYFLSKVRFFVDVLQNSPKENKIAIINISDPWGARLCEITKDCDFNKITFGRDLGDFNYKIQSMSATETRFTLQTAQGQFEVKSPLSGEHNVQNVVAALATVAGAGFDLRVAIHALKGFPGIPGRLQLVSNSQNRQVFVDYAHTPDGLENVLKTLRNIRAQSEHPGGRIWTIFGCGGDRDPGKRPIMAKIAESLSEEIVVTSDNPRTEDAEKIIDQIVAGFSSGARFTREVDRKKAIETTLELSGPNDLVLIAGKGHEETQTIGQQKFHFSDFEVAENYMKGVT
jgi:UDP-N-acetylmuramoyl-L-alanyl-D-glutamate--2,6-diaminopimelate ligase